MQADDPSLKSKIDFKADGQGSIKLTLPAGWLTEMQVTQENNNLTAAFDGQRIIISAGSEPYKEYWLRRLNSEAVNMLKLITMVRIFKQYTKLHSLDFCYDELDDLPGKFFDFLFHDFNRVMPELGFEVDLANSFYGRFREEEGKDKFEHFEKVLKEITDPKLLGTAIYSFIRIHGYWEDEEIKDEDLKRLAMAFRRLYYLTIPEYQALDKAEAESKKKGTKLPEQEFWALDRRIRGIDVSLYERGTIGPFEELLEDLFDRVKYKAEEEEDEE